MKTVKTESNVQTRDEMILKNLEMRISNNQFASKEELSQYLLSLKNRGIILQSVLTNEKIQELLDLFDKTNKKDEIPLDIQEYTSVGLEHQDLIISKQTDQVLKTLEGTSSFEAEFKQTQNEIIANKDDGLANADTVFKQMASHQKEELKLISVVEATYRDDINTEILNRIKFFITNRYINPYSFKVDVKNGVFYNIETNEVYEVRKNQNTNQYEIYKGSEMVYGEAEKQLEHDKDEEKQNYESKNNPPKTRKLVPQPTSHNNQAAFTKVGFLIINIITFTLLITMIILLNKQP